MKPTATSPEDPGGQKYPHTVNDAKSVVMTNTEFETFDVAPSVEVGRGIPHLSESQLAQLQATQDAIEHHEKDAEIVRLKLEIEQLKVGTATAPIVANILAGIQAVDQNRLLKLLDVVVERTETRPSQRGAGGVVGYHVFLEDDWVAHLKLTRHALAETFELAEKHLRNPTG